MKRIISILAILTVAECAVLTIEAKADTTATFTSSGSVPATCSLTVSTGVLTPTTNTINGANFPTELTSIANPVTFATLCNTLSSGIKIEVTAVTSPIDSGGSPYTATYNLSATDSSAYVGNPILGNDIPISPVITGTIAHSFSLTPSDLIVEGKLKTNTGKILGNGDYEIKIKTTLTP
jgi:hypothetical protein